MRLFRYLTSKLNFNVYNFKVKKKKENTMVKKENILVKNGNILVKKISSVGVKFFLGGVKARKTFYF